MGVSHSGEEGGYILEGRVDSGSVAYLGGGYIGRAGQIRGGRDHRMDSGSVAYSCRKGGYNIL